MRLLVLECLHIVVFELGHGREGWSLINVQKSAFLDPDKMHSLLQHVFVKHDVCVLLFRYNILCPNLCRHKL